MSLARSIFRQSTAIARQTNALQSPVRASTLAPRLSVFPRASAAPSPRLFTTSLRTRDEASPPASSSETPPKGTPIGQIEQRLQLTFTCTVDSCGHRSTHEFAKRSYEKGIVIVQCPGCQNRHLIADHLSWFTENASEPKTVEQMVAEKGGRVRTGRRTSSGDGVEGDQGETIEILTDSEADALEKNVKASNEGQQ